MRVVIFIVCLFYILFGGYNYLYTGKQSCSPHLIKSNVKFDNKQNASVVKAVQFSQPGTHLALDIEDEDSNNTATRKYKLLARCLYALVNSFILTCLYSCFRSSKPYSSLFAFKYITQRVLRIWCYHKFRNPRYDPIFCWTIVSYYTPPAL
jgi:hypothetical protein